MEFKEYQQGVLRKLDYYLNTLYKAHHRALKILDLDREDDPNAKISNFCRDTWEQLVDERRLPMLRDDNGGVVVPPYMPRFDGLDFPIPNVCLKVPTAGGKTLLGAAAMERIQTDFLRKQTGFVLWIVPSDSIYKQTWKHLANREHPYRQMLERASGGRVRLLEKNDSFTQREVRENLCVMLLMLQSSNRKSKETLKLFRDTGRFTSFFPVEDDVPKNEALLKSVRNLDVNDLASYGWQNGIAPGSVSIKQSLGNVMRIVRPVIIIDEGHKAYTETARDTICGFNPAFILELSATPNANGQHQSNVLVNVPGSDLKDEEMIKLPINVINEDKGDWKPTLVSAHQQLKVLGDQARYLQAETGRYIRPIMLIRVERTGRDQRDSKFIHADDAREYLIKHLGVKEEEIREKSAEKDELGNEDLMLKTSPVRYIITKDALREGWDCSYAYVLTILSKMTAQTAITQMVGRILRQPHVSLTNNEALDQCYVFTYDQDVNDAVNGVKKGLEDEGMADLSSYVRASGGNSGANKQTRKQTLSLRDKFRSLPKIFLPTLLHCDPEEASGYRAFDYERDILGNIVWEEINFRDAAGTFEVVHQNRQRNLVQVGLTSSGKNQQQSIEFSTTNEDVLFDDSMELDTPFLVRQLMEVIPNPWQAMQVLRETLDILRERKFTEEVIYINRLDLIQAMKQELKKQALAQSEELFRSKIERGEISLRLLASPHESLNWELARELEINRSDEDRELYRKDGTCLESSLFEKVYQRNLNNLEKDTALYLDTSKAVYWWHRIAVNQKEYSLQGWQQQKVYPDILVCIEQSDANSYRFSVLETKGEHLKGNDDTEYKRKLFELLTDHAKTSVDAGELKLEAASGGMTFKMLMESSWKQDIGSELA